MSLFVARRTQYYRISPAGSTPDPLPRDRSARLVIDSATGLFVYPEGRWSSSAIDALYTSHRPETARAEVEHHAAGRPPTKARIGWVVAATPTFAGPTGPLTEEHVILEFDGFPVDPVNTWDVRGLPDVDDAFDPLMIPWDWEPPQRIGEAHLAHSRYRLIVPACPPWNRTPRSVEWNTVLYIGDDRLDPDTLPGWSAMRLVDAFLVTKSPR